MIEIGARHRQLTRTGAFLTDARELGVKAQCAEELPKTVRIREVGPARRLPERARGDPDRGEGPADPAARRDRPEADRAHLLRAPRRDPAARRRRRGADALRAAGGGRLLGADPEPQGPRQRAALPRPLPGGELLPLGLRDPQPEERQPLDRRVPGRPGGHDRRGAGGRACAARA